MHCFKGSKEKKFPPLPFCELQKDITNGIF